MAVTKTHPIKSTLKAAIDYILNPEKTDGKLLASSFGCGLETADTVIMKPICPSAKKLLNSLGI